MLLQLEKCRIFRIEAYLDVSIKLPSMQGIQCTRQSVMGNRRRLMQRAAEMARW